MNENRPKCLNCRRNVVRQTKKKKNGKRYNEKLCSTCRNLGFRNADVDISQPSE